jgi:hypothetical protein
MQRLLVIAVLVSVGFIGGCTPWATFPPIEGAVDFNNPALEPIPTLMARAIQRAAEQDETSGTIVFNLPEDTPESVWRKVAERLGDAKAMTTAGQAAYHVTTVRIRTVEGEVDVVSSGPDEVPQLRTIGFKQQIDGWKIVSTRNWRVRITAPEPHYPPDSDEGASPPSTQPAGDG